MSADRPMIAAATSDGSSERINSAVNLTGDIRVLKMGDWACTFLWSISSGFRTVCQDGKVAAYFAVKIQGSPSKGEPFSWHRRL